MILRFACFSIPKLLPIRLVSTRPVIIIGALQFPRPPAGEPPRNHAAQQHGSDDEGKLAGDDPGLHAVKQAAQAGDGQQGYPFLPVGGAAWPDPAGFFSLLIISFKPAGKFSAGTSTTGSAIPPAGRRRPAVLVDKSCQKFQNRAGPDAATGRR